MPIIRYFVFVGLVLGGLIWTAGAFLLPPPRENAATNSANEKRAEDAAALMKRKTNAMYHVPATPQIAVSDAASAAADRPKNRNAATAVSDTQAGQARSASSRKKKRASKIVTAHQGRNRTQVVEQKAVSPPAFFDF